MKSKKFKKASYIELHELEEGKYRNWESSGIYKISDKESWFSKNDEKIELTDQGFEDLNKMGLNPNLNMNSVVFDFLTQREVDNRIKKTEDMVKFYESKLNTLKTL